jgi:hypothetical protein
VSQATPAEILTGEVLPPAFEWWRVFTEWKIDLMWADCAFGIFFYIAGTIASQSEVIIGQSRELFVGVGNACSGY